MVQLLLNLRRATTDLIAEIVSKTTELVRCADDHTNSIVNSHLGHCQGVIPVFGAVIDVRDEVTVNVNKWLGHRSPFQMRENSNA